MWRTLSVNSGSNLKANRWEVMELDNAKNMKPLRTKKKAAKKSPLEAGRRSDILKSLSALINTKDERTVHITYSN